MRWFVVFAWLSTLGNLAYAQHHERKRTERAEILAMETEWRQAQLTGDTTAMDQLLADDFLGVTAAGQVVTKAQQLDRMRTRQIALAKMDMAQTKIKMSGNLAVVTSVVMLEGTANGAPLHGEFRYTRVYQRTPGSGWKITSFEATRVPDQVGLHGTGVTSPQAGAGMPPAAAPSSHPASLARSGSPRPPS